MALQSHSQNISIRETKRVSTFINEFGDTLVIMHYEDARILLEDVLHYEYADSLLQVYKERDSLNTNVIAMQKGVIDRLNAKNDNFETIVANLEKIIANKDEEIALNQDVIKQQKKEIRKQKFLKIVGFSGSVILPIITLLALL